MPSPVGYDMLVESVSARGIDGARASDISVDGASALVVSGVEPGQCSKDASQDCVMPSCDEGRIDVVPRLVRGRGAKRSGGAKLDNLPDDAQRQVPGYQGTAGASTTPNNAFRMMMNGRMNNTGGYRATAAKNKKFVHKNKRSSTPRCGMKSGQPSIKRFLKDAKKPGCQSGQVFPVDLKDYEANQSGSSTESCGDF